jgi:hypothetical protein
MTMAPKLDMHFACPGSGQTDSVITNCSDKWLNFLSGIKCYFESMNFDGMIILSCTVIDKVLSAWKEAFFHFGWDSYIVGV